MITEPRREVPLLDSCEVLVCGGGFAGISAALAAARLGKKVILLEKQFMLGGLGTAGLITIYLPLCDGMGSQVSFGIAEELLKLSISMGAEGRYPHNWLDSTAPANRTDKDPRYEVQYNPQLFAILAEKLLLETGVKILYGTSVVAVDKSEDHIRHVIIENKSGRMAIAADTVVDATGDCDVAYLAEAPTALFQQGNVLAAWYYSVGSGEYKLNTLGFADIPEEHKTAQNRVPTLVNRRFQGISGEELSEMVQLSHHSILADLMKKRKEDASILPVTMATIPQVRMTRKLVGEYVQDDMQMHQYFEDSIGMVSDWRKRGPVYEVSFRTLYSSRVKNLICAGRCTSVTDNMWDIMRVIPCCAVTGQAAGTAAALTDDFSRIDISALQQILRQNGVILHEQDLPKAYSIKNTTAAT